MLICFVYWLVRMPEPALDAAFQREMCFWFFFFLWRDVLPEKSVLCSAASLSKNRTGFFCIAIPPFLWDEEQFLPWKFGSVVVSLVFKIKVLRGYSKTSYSAWLHLLFLIPFPNPLVMGDKTVFSTIPCLPFCKCEGNKEEDDVIHGLCHGSVRSVLRRQFLLPFMAGGCSSHSSDPRSCWVWD